MAKEKTYAGGLAETGSGANAKGAGGYRDFFAVEYSFNQSYAAYYVGGEVLVANPGVEAMLYYRVPQGINPKILMLDLVLIQRPGNWASVQTWVPAKYLRMGKPGQYSDVEILGPPGNITLKVTKLP